MFLLMNVPLYYENVPHLWQGYIDEDLYYPELIDLGLTHIVTFGGDYDYQGLYYIPAYSLDPNFNPVLKVLDRYFTTRLTRYFPPNQFFGGVYAGSQGNEFNNFEYQVGGVSANLSETGRFGFGTQERSAIWVTEPPPIGESFDEPSGETVFRAVVNNPNYDVGYLLEVELPAWHQARKPEITSWNPESIEYRLVLNARIDGYTNSSDMTPVATVEIFETFIPFEDRGNDLRNHPHYPPFDMDSESGQASYTSYNIYVKDFGGNSYVDLLSPVYFHKNLGTDATLKIKVFWHDNKNFYIDHFFIYDNFYESLFLVQDPTPTYDEIKQQFQNVFGNFVTNDLYSHFYLDEPWPNSYRSIEKISELSSEAFPNYPDKYVNGATGDFPPWMRQLGNSQRRLPYVLNDKYVLWYIYSTSSDPSIENNLQDALDSLIYSERPDYDSRGLKIAIDMAQNYTPNDYSDDVPFLHTIQVQAEKRIENGTIPNNGYNLRLRAPKPNEILAQGFLSLCYGAKGLAYYTIWTNTESSTDIGDVLSTYGLFDEEGNHYSDEGGQLSGFIQDPANPQETNERFDAVKELNQEISLIEDELLTLTWKEAYSIHKVQPPIEINYIKGLSSSDLSGNSDPPDETFVELGFFKKTAEYNNNLLDYFMLVNRRGLDTEGRTYEVSYDKAGTPYVNWRVWDEATSENWPGFAVDDFAVYIDPGKGKLFNLEPTVIGGGNLISSETINGDVDLKRDLIIESGVTLTVNANYHCYGNITIKDGGVLRTTDNGKIYFYDQKRLTVEGQAAIYSTSSNMLVLDFIAPHTINGINVKVNGLLDIYNCRILNSRYGIKVESGANKVTVDNVDFENCNDYCINISGPNNDMSSLSNSSFINSTGGISAVNVSETTITGNQFQDNELGIYLSSVTNAHIINNQINSVLESMPGIFLESSNGDIRGNAISGHTNGIHLGNSSPDIGDNTITDNLYHGIYIGSGSLPNMVGELVSDPPIFYPISGYNTIFDNGGWDYPNSPPDNDGSEIYISFANLLMSDGCNSILDDRVPSGHLINTKYLMSGVNFGLPIVVKADNNFWGDNPLYPLQDRFNGLIVYYQPYYLEPCPIPQGASGGENELFITASNGEVIDTIYSVEREIGNLSTTDLLYAVAEENFLSSDYASAEVIYNDIINSSDTLYAKLEAYQMLYNIGKLSNKSTGYFSNLYTDYSSLGQNAEDSLMHKMFKQLASLSLVGKTEYVPAIVEFDEIVQQNPGSEEAIYAEIDALTASLLVEPGDSTLGKKSGGRYLVKNSSDYHSKVSSLLKNNFGSNSESATNEILPEEFYLYQNYPNPFNPTTIIRYDIAKAGQVELFIYDVLGRRIKTVVNKFQNSGSYEAVFDASHLASGVYFYQLRAKSFVVTKKMLLLR
jgi:parallel beta-helix repeat protein